ncbi:translocation protein SEC62 isoform X1 [Centruroides vittatus]|uniref:translocation protein SEC62 isoform X1 n=1 Tax=Centruroides vittatus TaxID=120091 RepID=UPI00350F2FAB
MNCCTDPSCFKRRKINVSKPILENVKLEQEIQEESKPTKVEYAIAKYLRDKLPAKKTTLLSHKVEYFIASKAIDCLMDSPWAKSKKMEANFTTRESIVEFMDNMLRHKFFHRAKKIVVQKDSKKKKKEKDEETNAGSEETKEKEKKLKDKEKKSKSEKEEKADTKKEEGPEKKKEKKKIKLDMHLEQVFVDGNEAYVWIYDPIPVRAWVIGTLLVVGAVLVCLFPLWPKIVRHYVYYLSIAATGFLILIIGLAVVRLAVFVIIWLVSFGKHHLWLLPNLTEDVGFIESFWPLYKYEFKGQKDKNGEKEEKPIQTKETTEDKEESTTDQEGKESEDQVHSESEKDSEVERDRIERENGDNGFEILDPCEELDQDKKDKPTVNPKV